MLKPKTYTILSDCIDIGVDIGWNRAHKHTDEPSEGEIKQQIARNIMIEILEKFDIIDESENNKSAPRSNTVQDHSGDGPESDF